MRYRWDYSSYEPNNRLYKVEALKRKWAIIIVWMFCVAASVWIILALGQTIGDGK